MASSYVIALGSNRRGRHGGPGDEIRAAAAAIGGVVAMSRLIETPPLGPAARRFVNAAALIESDEPPRDLLERLKAIEAKFGRRPGQRWRDRVIDLDIVLWSGGAWADDRLTIPHPAFRGRAFVLEPLAALVPDWRDPLTGLTIRQLAARLTRRARLA
ncbi:2-amino-4-hydroxy-6-hydroxymethyldihydropteridine diphosphokinase [Sphingomonas sp.]|jgi:2-amino-4-hydroxy-6-hydroxymethyldihydropteridine diphosphokinase|uniref:2-amino-4-hydroxy-6- hydroxymethyldihydropteridine diphosphokinase n=1 Tax=Sphingomonas sp. TaxID=28214 RepID=UPI002E374B21|nr:2-amino-4-hydroxy-6-hydroxymethyldihydropteridine diphosphokinase [Sphingomonas sp.]HEX4695383.1 2-amino-4-hydroxy-6-hydroxymethyldihydropteridine diphosphokinase [Sphingomonas sp.]